MGSRYTITYHEAYLNNSDSLNENNQSKEVEVPGWFCSIKDEETSLVVREWASTKGESQEKAFKSLNNLLLKQNQDIVAAPDNPYDEESHLNIENKNDGSPTFKSISKNKTSIIKTIVIILVSTIVISGTIFVLTQNTSKNKNRTESNSNIEGDSNPHTVVQSKSYDANAKTLTPTNSNENKLAVSQSEISPSNSNLGSNSNNEDFYILNTHAVKTEQEAVRKTKELQSKGYNAGYLWIPNYASLSNRQLYTVYIGPFFSQYECEKATENYRKIVPGAYGTLVSQRPIRTQINGIGKIITTNLNQTSEYCNGSQNQSKQYVIVQEDNIRVRSVPSSDNDKTILFRLFLNDKGTILDSHINTVGELWYKVCYNDQIGWIIGKYVEVRSF